MYFNAPNPNLDGFAAESDLGDKTLLLVVIREANRCDLSNIRAIVIGKLVQITSSSRAGPESPKCGLLVSVFYSYALPSNGCLLQLTAVFGLKNQETVV